MKVWGYAFVIGLSSLAADALAWGDSGYGGCCAEAVEKLIKLQPAEVRESGARTYQILLETPDNDLALFRAVGAEICDHMDCKGLEPSFVQQLVSMAADRRQYVADQQRQAAVDQATRVSAIATALATVIVAIAAVPSYLSLRRSWKKKIAVADLRNDPRT